MEPSERVKAVIRYILSPGSPLFDISALQWEPTEKETTLYRGQCNVSTKQIPRLGSNPLEISLAYGRPISTSSELSNAIWKFACKPGGRLFEIHVAPGVPVSVLSKSVDRPTLTKESFQFLKDELPDTSGYKKMSVAQLRAVFLKKLEEEKEVLLDPKSGTFKKESGEVEDWSSEEVPRGDKTVYVTMFVPTKAGRRRKTRRRSRRACPPMRALILR